MNADFEWSEQRVEAAEMLAEGFMLKEVAEKVGVSVRALYDWRQEAAFEQEVDRLTMMRGLAIRAERARVAKRAIKRMIDEETGDIKTSKDILDWLKYMQSETNGAIFSIPELTALVTQATSMAGGRQEESPEPPQPAE